MKIGSKVAFLSAALSALMLPGMTQTSTPSPEPPVKKDPTAAQRKENQQNRIANGVASGQLTAGEARNLEKKEANLNKETRDMREHNGGKLSAADKAKLQHQQNRLSHQIYKDKHNAAVQNTNPKSEVGKRAENQQDRIAQGIKSGQLTAGEAAKLERKDAAINHEVRADRKANGGTLTPAEKAQVNHQQNKVSRQIYNKKHHGRHQ